MCVLFVRVSRFPGSRPLLLSVASTAALVLTFLAAAATIIITFRRRVTAVPADVTYVYTVSFCLLALAPVGGALAIIIIVAKRDPGRIA